MSSSGDFYARQGSLTGTFTLEATGVSSIALSSAGGNPAASRIPAGADPRVLGEDRGLQLALERHRAFGRSLHRTRRRHHDLGQRSRLCVAKRRLLREKAASAQAQWTKEASGVNAISLALIGQSDEPLLGYLDADSFYAGEGLTPAKWVDEATGVVQMAVASSTAPGALPVLGCVTAAGELEVLQGPLTVSFSLQARSVTSMALSSVTDS